MINLDVLPKAKPFIKINVNHKKYVDVHNINYQLTRLEELLKQYNYNITDEDVINILKSVYSKYKNVPLDDDLFLDPDFGYIKKLTARELNSINYRLCFKIKHYKSIQLQQIMATLIKMSNEEQIEIIKTYLRKNGFNITHIYTKDDLYNYEINPVELVIHNIITQLHDSFDDNCDLLMFKDIENFNNHLINKQIVDYVNDLNKMPDYK